MVRDVAKLVLFVIAVAVMSPLWIAARVAYRLLGNQDPFRAASQLISLVPGKTGIYLRRAFYWRTLLTCESDISVEFGTIFSHPEITVGKGVYIGARCTIGMCRIGDKALIGSNVDILSGRKQHGVDRTGTDFRDQPKRFEPIEIGCNCWLGNSSVVMADVGDNSVVGAGSIVVHPVPSGVTAVGNPASSR